MVFYNVTFPTLAASAGALRHETRGHGGFCGRNQAPASPWLSGWEFEGRLGGALEIAGKLAG